ncbi:glycoside hydrolase family 15 protein [Streptomyces chumphonensis]|uniref:Trehalase n=1 Tax=Streptomyces chumphonensis TaxID=1214925 RepID=A0A927IB27_9ACTN|nr:glycoside hydrolase family 15 protein [Streptomyces chumphonensis]MBD3930420.1 glycoside hydrolase family 15 protein [Streptomyces chumphonensis]
MTSTAIADYGMLADGSSAALVDRRGSVDWLCLPRFDSPALFARLLGEDAGHWSVTPTGGFDVRRRYVPGTLVLETTFTTAGGTACLRDALAVPEGQRGHDLGMRPPHELLREVEGLDGEVEFDVEFVPRPEYGLVRPLLRVDGRGARTFGGPNPCSLRSPVALRDGGGAARARVRVRAGERTGFALLWAPPEEVPPEPTAPEAVGERIADTVEAWRSWEADHDIYHGPHRDTVRLSARVLKGLTYRPTGAVVAAPTTSLPEAVGGERNWDYRYAWIRDASLTLEALYLGSCPDEAVDFVSFMTSAAGGGADAGSSLQIMYGVGGEHDLSERELGHLPGWRGSRPVRVGNDAWGQTQLDVYGELLNALYLYRDRLGELHPEVQRFAAGLADAAARRWEEPDAGMWEMRGPALHHVSSKVLCWVALDRAVRLAPQLGGYARTAVWGAARDRVHTAVLERGWSERRRAFTQSFDSEELDAAVLLMPLYGFLPPTDARVRSTVEAVARGLTEDGLVLRYRVADAGNADGLAGGEGTFALCSFWLVSALAMAGEPDRAQALFDRVAGCANDLGLLAEEIDPRTGELLGNFPQAFSHVGLINAAAAIDRARGVL